MICFVLVFFINKDPFVDKILQGVISVCADLGLTVACTVYKYI